MKKVLVYNILLAVLLLGSCKKEDPKDPAPLPNTFQHLKNVSYGDHERHTMDVMLPANRDVRTPVMVMIHGGSWNSGDKSELEWIMQQLKDSGVAVVAINYRYASATLDYADLMEDVHDAVNYIHDNAAHWGIKDNNFVIGGYSAGAHLALLYNYKYDTDDYTDAVVSLAGPTDFTDIDWLNYASMAGLIDVINHIVGATYVFGEPLTLDFANASPIHFASYADPTLMIHGSTDFVVPYGQSYNLHVQLNTASITNRIIEYPATGHDLGIADASRMSDILNHVVTWTRTYSR